MSGVDGAALTGSATGGGAAGLEAGRLGMNDAGAAADGIGAEAVDGMVGAAVGAAVGNPGAIVGWGGMTGISGAVRPCAALGSVGAA